MDAPAKVETVDKLIATFRQIMERQPKTVALIEAGVYYHRNNIVDITAEMLIDLN